MKPSPGFVLALQFFAFLVLLALVLTLAGCANGVVMTDDERIACRSEGCAVFTQRELMQFQGKTFELGYRHGWTDSNLQAGRNL